MMYMCTCVFKHSFLHEPVLNSTQLNSTRNTNIRTYMIFCLVLLGGTKPKLFMVFFEARFDSVFAVQIEEKYFFNSPD